MHQAGATSFTFSWLADFEDLFDIENLNLSAELTTGNNTAFKVIYLYDPPYISTYQKLTNQHLGWGALIFIAQCGGRELEKWYKNDNW